MELSAIDVQQKTFRERFRGYDPDDVEEFLDSVVATLRSKEQQVRGQEERIEQLERELATSREAEDAIKRTFIAAQRTSQEILGEAQEKAARMLDQARTESDQLVKQAAAESAGVREKATEEHEGLTRRVAQLRSAVADLQDRLKQFAEGSLVELEAVEASIDLETQSLSDILTAAAARAEGRPVVVEETGAVEEAEATEAGQPEGGQPAAEHEAPSEGSESREAAYLQQPRSQRPWERPEG